MAMTNTMAITPIVIITFLACCSSFWLCIAFVFTFSHGVFYSLKFNDEQSKKKFGKNANEREKIYSPLPANSIR